MTYASTVLADGPIAYWKLGETNGSTSIADSSGNSHAGSAHNSPVMGSTALVPSDAATSMLLGGNVSEYGWSVPASSAFDFSSGDFTVETWLKPTNAATNQVLVGLGSCYFGLQSGKPVLASLSTGAFSTGTLTLGSVYHIVVTRNSGVVKYYINGVLDSTQTWTDAFGSSTDPTTLGYFTIATFGMFGNAEHIALYNVGLTSTRVTAHFTAGQIAATAVTVTPTSTTGIVGTPVNFTVSHNGVTAADTITPSGTGFTFSPGTATVTSTGTSVFAISPTSAGTATITFSSSLGLTAATATLVSTTGPSFTAAKNLGDTVALSASTASVTATASAPGAITYVWHKGSTPGFTANSSTLVAGQTTATATFTGLSSSTDAWARCIMSDGTTTVNSFDRLLSISGLAPLRVGFIGDSTTYAALPPALINGVSGSLDRHAANYLRSRQGNRKVTTVNAGVAGSASTTWTSGSTNLNAAMSAFSTASFVSGDWVVVRLGVNDAQGHTSAATFAASMASMIGVLTGAGYRVQLDYPTCREAGQFFEDSTQTFDESTNPFLLQYFSAIDGLANGSTIFVGDKVSARNFFARPTSYLNRSTSLPGAIHPIVDGAIEMGVNSAEALTANMGLIGSFPTAAQVLAGVSFGSGLTGTVVLPSTSQVQNTIPFGPSGSLTGTLSGAVPRIGASPFISNA